MFELLRKHSADNIGKGTPEDEVAKVEEKLGVRFPSSYRRFLLEIGYAEVYGDEVYSIYDEPDDMACLGIVQQNVLSPLLAQGFLAVLSTDIDGTYLLKLEDGSVYLNDPESKVADSFEDILRILIGENS